MKSSVRVGNGVDGPDHPACSCSPLSCVGYVDYANNCTIYINISIPRQSPWSTVFKSPQICRDKSTSGMPFGTSTGIHLTHPEQCLGMDS
jgi:hypothetical protein